MVSEKAICEQAELLYRRTDLVSSAEEYCRALVHNPTYGRALFALPLILARLEKIDLTCVWARRLADSLKHDYRYQCQAAGLLSQFGKYCDALIITHRSICLNPASFTDWLVAAECDLNSQENSIKKIDYLDRCFKLNLDSFKAKILLAVRKRLDEKFYESIKILHSMKYGESNEEINFQLGKNYYELNNLDLAIKNFKKAIARQPGNFDYFFELSICYFQKFDFRNAWNAYSKRVFVFYASWGGRVGGRYLNDCRWLSGSGARGRVLVWAEEGIGDEIKSGSLLNEFRDRATKLLVQLDSRLIPLFRRSLSEGMEYISRDEIIPEDHYDVHVPIGNLGRYLRPSLESFSGRGGKYLWADRARVLEMRKSLARQPGERLIGISWLSTNPITGHDRSFTLKDFVQRMCITGVRLVNLQYGEVDPEIDSVQEELGIAIWRCPSLDTTNDLDGVAALIEACDEVFSIGNTTAHLAGALGQKTTVILRRASNWRWLEQDGQSLWYGSARVITWPKSSIIHLVD